MAELLRMSHDLFDDDAIVLAHMADVVALKSDKGSRQVRVAYPTCPILDSLGCAQYGRAFISVSSHGRPFHPGGNRGRLPV